jgi:hypothetical protein
MLMCVFSWVSSSILKYECDTSVCVCVISVCWVRVYICFLPYTVVFAGVRVRGMLFVFLWPGLKCKFCWYRGVYLVVYWNLDIFT